MKKFFLFFVAIIACLNANAILDPKFEMAKSTVSYTKSSVNLEGEDYTTITFSIDNLDSFMAFQFYFDCDKSAIIDIQAADGPLTEKSKVGLKKVDKFSFTYSSTSNYPTGSTLDASYPTCFCSWNTSNTNTMEAIGSGEFFTIYLDPTATGEIKTIGIVTAPDGSTLNLADMTIDLSEANEIVGVKNADSSVKSANKYVKNGHVVVKKDAKEYSVFGIQTK